MIRVATEQDIPRIKELWEQCFQDPLNYVDFFYNNITTPAHTYLCEEGPGVVAMATLLPARFVFREQQAEVRYIYGAATDPRFQGQGTMSSLLRHCERLIKEQGGAMSVLVPGERHLFDFYKRRGYSADFSLRVVRIRPGMLTAAGEDGFSFGIGEIGPGEMFSIREDSLSDVPHLCWSESLLEAILKDCAAYGEQVAHCVRGQERAYAVFGMAGRRMVIKECLGTSPAAMTELIRRLIAAKDPGSAVARLACDAPIFRFEGETVRFGMAKQLVATSTIRDMEPYMNLMLD